MGGKWGGREGICEVKGNRRKHTWPTVEESHGNSVWIGREESYEVNFEFLFSKRDGRHEIRERIHVRFTLSPIFQS
jgi:hypothetical protein